MSNEKENTIIPPWAGAWEWLGDGYDGRTAFTERHYCYASAKQERKAPVGEHPSDAEAAALFRSFGVAVAGTFTTQQVGDEWHVDHIHLIDKYPDRVGVHEHNVYWVEGDMKFNQGFGDDGSRGPVPPHQYRRLSHLGSSALAGSWELISDQWGGLMIMTDSHYRYVMVRNDRPFVAGNLSDLSDADAAAFYHSLDAQCGSQSFAGSTLLRQPIVAKNPRDKGRELHMDFLIEGETLTIRYEQQERKWRKVV